MIHSFIPSSQANNSMIVLMIKSKSTFWQHWLCVIQQLWIFMKTLFLGSYTLTTWTPRTWLELLAASDKYNLKLLFNQCQLRLSHNIDVDTAAVYFLAAYMHVEATLLKETSLRFIIDHYKEVKKTSGFAKMYQVPKALLEILDEAIDKP